MTDRRPAEVFHPGEFLSEELEARDWNQADLAAILGCTKRRISEVVSGKRSVTPDTARGLGAAFGTGAQFWLNLESAYQLFKLSKLNNGTAEVERKARIFSKAPVREMIRRAWIEDSNNAEVLEERVLDLYGIGSLDEDPRLWLHAARKSSSYSDVTPAQWAWLCRARQLAKGVAARRFSNSRFDGALDELRSLLLSPEEIRRIPKILSDGGIRLVIVEHLKSTRIDGATFWLNKDSPVVALSLRYNRIDWFWHTLVHELAHVKNQDGLADDSRPLDIDLFGDGSTTDSDKPEFERRADQFAAEFLVNQSDLNNFISRVGPIYSKKLIRGFANRVGVHTGVVIGQLQHRGEIPWTHYREMLVRVREIVTASALTDGWGFTAPAPPPA